MNKIKILAYKIYKKKIILSSPLRILLLFNYIAFPVKSTYEKVSAISTRLNLYKPTFYINCGDMLMCYFFTSIKR